MAKHAGDDVEFGAFLAEEGGGGVFEVVDVEVGESSNGAEAVEDGGQPVGPRGLPLWRWRWR
ncbi:hypothetical protein, partial [Actinospica durhamensis]|uniref:hypothetical protein n=1 Tax=Actinospica durhamensis TaxID=1508375 RepID=UPI001FE43F5E